MILTVANSCGNWTHLAVVNCQRCHGICSLTSCCSRHLLCEHFVKSSYETVNVQLCNAKRSSSCQVGAWIVGVMSTETGEAMSRLFLVLYRRCGILHRSVCVIPPSAARLSGSMWRRFLLHRIDAYNTSEVSRQCNVNIYFDSCHMTLIIPRVTNLRTPQNSDREWEQIRLLENNDTTTRVCMSFVATRQCRVFETVERRGSQGLYIGLRTQAWKPACSDPGGLSQLKHKTIKLNKTVGIWLLKIFNSFHDQMAVNIKVYIFILF